MDKHILIAALEPFANEIARIGVELHVMQSKAAIPGADGLPGKDADPAAVAALLRDDPEFISKTKAADPLPGDPGKDGAPGADGMPGKDGAPGADGLGLTATAYKAGDIYTEGAVVVAHLGQHYKAVKNTYSTPGDSSEWERIGLHGFRHCGPFDEGKAYAEGDIVIKNYGAFLFTRGAFEILCGRGMKGERGDVGVSGQAGPVGPAGCDGLPGKDGRDGSRILSADMKGCKALLTIEDAGGLVDVIELDFTQAVRSEAQELVQRAYAPLQAQLEELAAVIADLQRGTPAYGAVKGRRHG
jgi:hypothetical protein